MPARAPAARAYRHVLSRRAPGRRLRAHATRSPRARSGAFHQRAHLRRTLPRRNDRRGLFDDTLASGRGRRVVSAVRRSNSASVPVRSGAERGDAGPWIVHALQEQPIARLRRLRGVDEIPSAARTLKRTRGSVSPVMPRSGRRQGGRRARRGSASRIAFSRTPGTASASAAGNETIVQRRRVRRASRARGGGRTGDVRRRRQRREQRHRRRAGADRRAAAARCGATTGCRARERVTSAAVSRAPESGRGPAGCVPSRLIR